MTKKASHSKQSKLVHKFHEGVLNTVAVCLAMLPILFVGVWFQGVVNGVDSFADTRKVTTLQVLPKSSTPQLFSEPLVSVTFDDGWHSIYESGAPVLEKYGIRTTQYILPGEFDNKGYISKAQAHSLKNAGHEIGSHTIDHKKLTDLGNADVLYELETSKNMLKKENLLSEGNISFASPNSAFNESILFNVSKFYSSHRNTLADLTNGMNNADVNIGPILPRYNIIAFSVRNNTTVRQIQVALDYAKQQNAWFVLVYHQIDDSDTLYSVDKSTLDKQLKVVKQSKIKIVTVGEVMATNPRSQ